MARSGRRGEPTSGPIAHWVAEHGDWRGDRIAEIRRIIREADPDVVEDVKWRKPSNPSGAPVWSHDGIICVGDSLKNRVRLTFPKGASLEDPRGLFNARLDSRTVRAMDIPEGHRMNEGALQALVRGAVALNAAAAKKR